MKNLPKRLLLQPLPVAVVISAFCSAAISDVAIENATNTLDGEEGSNLIEMVVVTGSATGGLDTEITSDDIERIAAADLADIFRLDPAISAGGAVGVGQKIVLRGLGEDTLNIAIDGADQTNGVFHHAGRISIDPELLKQVQIEVGAGSATAGPGALGGSIHFATKDPKDLLGSDDSVGGLLKTSYFDNGGRTKLSGSIYGKITDSVSGLISLSSSNGGGLVQDGDGLEIDGTDSDQSLGFAKVLFDLTKEQSLSLSYENITDEGMLPYRSEWLVDVLSPTEVNRNTTTINYSFIRDDVLNLKATAYNTENAQDRFFGGADDAPVEGDTSSLGLNLQNTSKFYGQELIYGLNYRDDEANLWYLYEGDVFTTEETGSVLGYYIQDVVELSDMFTLSAGARFDSYEFTDKNGSEHDDSGLSPNISAVFSLSGVSVSAGYAQALRGVEASDPYKADTVAGYAEDLEAEKADNIEFAIEYENDGFSAGAGVFKSTIQDAIVSASALPDTIAPWGRFITNLDDDIETEGYFVNLGYTYADFGVTADFQSAETIVSNQLATRYLWAGKANNIGDTLVLNSYYNISESITLGWVVEDVQSINNIRQTENLAGFYDLSLSKPAYTVHDLYVDWDLNQYVRVNFVVKNALDENYLSHAAVEDYTNNEEFERIRGQNDPGRDLRLSLSLSF